MRQWEACLLDGRGSRGAKMALIYLNKTTADFGNTGLVSFRSTSFDIGGQACQSRFHSSLVATTTFITVAITEKICFLRSVTIAIFSSCMLVTSHRLPTPTLTVS